MASVWEGLNLIRTTLSHGADNACTKLGTQTAVEAMLPFVSKICVGSETCQSNPDHRSTRILRKGHGFI